MVGGGEGRCVLAGDVDVLFYGYAFRVEGERLQLLMEKMTLGVS